MQKDKTPFPKVVTACAGRFHLFDQAKQLYRHGLLHGLVTDYPKTRVAAWQIPQNMVFARPWRSLGNSLLMKAIRKTPFSIRSRVWQGIHQGFARTLPSRVPADSDVLISHSSFMLEAMSWAKQRGMTVCVDHGSLHESHVRNIMVEECDTFGFSPFGNWQYPWLLDREENEFRSADRILVCSELARQSMVGQGMIADKVFVNHLGVDLSMFYPAQKRDAVFRVMYCGGLNPMKGVQYLLPAFRDLKLPNSEMLLVGGMSPDPAVQEFISPYLRENNISYRGTFPQQKLRDIYAQSSVLVLPSLADGWGMVVQQAMACGTPVIVTDMAGVSEAVDDGINGFVIPSRSVEAIKEKLLAMYESPAMTEKMGVRAAKATRSGYTWDDYGDRLCACLRRLHEL